MFAQTPVILMPVPKPQYFTQAGVPLGFGCVFTYQEGTTTPLATYTDATGTTQNANPVVLSGGGTGSIWIQAGVAYSIKVVSFGGTNCASGTTQYTVDGVGGGVTTLTTNVTYSATPFFQIAAQNQLFKITLGGNASSQPLTAVGIIAPGLVTWEITQDVAGGHTFSWPANSVGGCSIGSAPNQVTLQHFVWDGFTAIATGPCVIGNGPAINAGNITALSLTSTTAAPAASGVLRLARTDAINWRNATNSGDEGFTTDVADRLLISHPAGVILTGIAPNLFFGGAGNLNSMLLPNGPSVAVRRGDNTGDGNFSAATGTFSNHIVVDGTTIVGTAATNQVLTATSPSAAAFVALPSSIQAAYKTTALVNSAIPNSNTIVFSQAVTMPASGCPCRVLAAWFMYLSTGASGQDVAYVSDGTNTWAGSETSTAGSASGFGFQGSGNSPATYANGANVTFTVIMASSHAAGTTVSGTQLGTGISGAPSSQLQLTVLSSN